MAETYRLRPAARADLASGRRNGKPVAVRTGDLKYACGSHIIYYRLTDGLEIVRILHQRMDVETHLAP